MTIICCLFYIIRQAVGNAFSLTAQSEPRNNISSKSYSC